MIVREHNSDGTRSVAVYSACETYRYALTREWDAGAKKVCFVMLNPSTADELRNDPTVERCERRARALGFGAFRVVNIFAFRATDPRDLKKASEPVGDGNDTALGEALEWADMTVAAWGAHGDHLGQGAAVAKSLKAAGKPLHHLGLTKRGHPRHPLYVSYQVNPTPWD